MDREKNCGNGFAATNPSYLRNFSSIRPVDWQRWSPEDRGEIWDARTVIGCFWNRSICSVLACTRRFCGGCWRFGGGVRFGENDRASLGISSEQIEVVAKKTTQNSHRRRLLA